MYVGETTSTITYDMLLLQWVWYDRMNNKSIATGSSSYASLLIGVHTVDFSGVVDDECQHNGVVRRLKLTTCTHGKFTCSDGECVDIEKRCDQTEHCRDKSDEENCQITHMKSRYNEKIAPFKLNNFTEKYR